MSFSAPDLVTDLDSTNFKNELNQNFEKIEQALIDIQNLFPYYNVSSQAVNLAWIETALRPNGIVGTLSFVPVLSTDQDYITISHDTADGYSMAIIGDRIHRSDTEWTGNFGDIITVDGDYTVILGLRSLGAPFCEVKLEVEDTDNISDLVLYRMDVNRNGTAWTVTNLRLVAEVLMDRESFSRVYEFQHPMTLHYAGTLPGTAGALPLGFIVPWKCQITGAFLRLETGPTLTDGVSIELRTGASATDAVNVLADTASWSVGEDETVKELTALSQPTILAAGAYVYPYVVTADAAASDLTVVLLLQRLYHQTL